MKKLIIPAVFFGVFSASSAMAAACHEPVYPWPNDGSCVFDVFCALGRSGDMDVRDGVKMQECHLDRINEVNKRPSSPPPVEPECEEPRSLKKRDEIDYCLIDEADYE